MVNAKVKETLSKVLFTAAAIICIVAFMFMLVLNMDKVLKNLKHSH